jgi:hypothetical protein
MYKKYSLMAITRVLDALKEGRATRKENHLQGPDEARQNTNIKTSVPTGFMKNIIVGMIFSFLHLYILGF